MSWAEIIALGALSIALFLTGLMLGQMVNALIGEDY